VQVWRLEHYFNILENTVLDGVLAVFKYGVWDGVLETRPMNHAS
jgi:hypothetical protein